MQGDGLPAGRSSLVPLCAPVASCEALARLLVQGRRSREVGNSHANVISSVATSMFPGAFIGFSKGKTPSVVHQPTLSSKTLIVSLYFFVWNKTLLLRERFPFK